MPIYKKVNKDFFKKWTSSMSYILGFFAADGYITVNKRGGQFWCIQITDKDLLYKIREAIGADHKISERIGKGNNKNLYRLQIGSFEMCDDLRKLGYSENKTKSLAIPQIPKKYFSDFVRGYFDGDGNVWVGLMHKERKTKTLAISVVFTSCSKEFLLVLKSKLEEFDIYKGVLRDCSSNFYRLTYSINNTLKLFNFMYNSINLEKDGLYLKRKQTVFERFMKMRA